MWSVQRTSTGTRFDDTARFDPFHKASFSNNYQAGLPMKLSTLLFLVLSNFSMILSVHGNCMVCPDGPDPSAAEIPGCTNLDALWVLLRCPYIHFNFLWYSTSHHTFFKIWGCYWCWRMCGNPKVVHAHMLPVAALNDCQGECLWLVSQWCFRCWSSSRVAVFHWIRDVCSTHVWVRK